MDSIILRKIGGVLMPLLRRRAGRSFAMTPGVPVVSLFGLLASPLFVSLVLLALTIAWLLTHPITSLHVPAGFGVIGMAYANNATDAVYYKVEASYNTAPGASGSEGLRIKPSQGFSPTRALIDDEETQSDALSRMPRMGSRSVPGTFELQGYVDALDTPIEALTRSTWVAATAITVDNTAANVSFQVTNTSTVTYVGTTTLLTKGLRVGDVCRFTNMSTAANNSINIRIKTIAADGLSFTVFGTPLTVQGADTSATLTIARKVKNGTSPTERTFYFDNYNGSIDISAVVGGAKFGSLRLVGTPDGVVTMTVGLLGASYTALATGASPYYSSPTTTTTKTLAWIDGAIASSGVDLATVTSFELNYVIPLSLQTGIGGTVSLDTFAGRAKVTGRISFVRQDLAYATAALAETDYEFHVMLVENESEPKDFLSCFVPYVHLANPQAPVGGDGPKIEDYDFVTGKKEGASATGYDDTLVAWSTSAT